MSSKVREIINIICNIKNLSPSEENNYIFNSLVENILDSKKDFNINNKQKQKVRLITQKAEYELEKYWSANISKSKNPKETIKQFPYYNNYLELCELEFSNLVRLNSKIKRVLFLGSGPLPMSAILLAEKYKIKVDLIDISLEAVNLSVAIIESLALQKYINIKLEDAYKLTLDHKYDFIIIGASILKADIEVNKLLKDLLNKNKKDTLVLIRHAEGNNSLLYRELKISKLYIKPILNIRPYLKIINSILIFKTNI